MLLFDQECYRIQEGFNRLEWIDLVEANPTTAIFKTRAGNLEVSAPGQGMLRLRLDRGPQYDYGMLTGEIHNQPLSLHETGNVFHIHTDEFELILSPYPLRLQVFRRGELILESSTDRSIQGDYRLFPLAASDDQWLASFALNSGESVFGLGEKFCNLDRRGQLITSWNRDATGVNAELSYKNVPFAWSPRGWALFFHTPARVTHGVGYAPWSHRSYVAKVEDPNLDLFLIFGETPLEMLEKYTGLTGRAGPPPVWAYGMWMSKAYYKTASELLEVAEKLRQRRIPCDVLTLDGRAWHKSETRFDFEWDPERYPDPAGFVRSLRDLDYRLCLWEYSYLSTKNPLFEELTEKEYFLKTPDGETYIHRWLPPPNDELIPHLQPSGLLDFTNPEAYAWFRDQHRDLFEMGVSVMKTDYGEAVPEEVVGHNGESGKRLHNTYSLLYNRCVYEAAQKFGDREGIVWARSSWTGGQRYPVHWGGDPQSDWEGLAGSIRGGLAWGMSGGAYFAHDIGGFYGKEMDGGMLGGGMPEPELYLRWAQAGVLASHTRFHGVGPREPWEYGEEAETIVRGWLSLRYRLIPYLQACAEQAAQSGIPVMRAMPLVFPDDPLSWRFETQYLFGPALLVAPVLSPGGKVQVYLPVGEWFDLWSGESMVGPRRLEVIAPLDRLPVYGRAGETLLLGPAVQHTGQITSDSPVETVTFGKDPFILQMDF
jgi:alpha-D-xyloside xylohydrolase